MHRGQPPWDDAMPSGVQKTLRGHGDASSSFYEKLKFPLRSPRAFYPLSYASLALMSSGTPLSFDGSSIHACVRSLILPGAIVDPEQST